MKKLLLTGLVVAAVFTVANAQNAIEKAAISNSVISKKAVNHVASKSLTSACGLDTSSYLENSSTTGSFSGFKLREGQFTWAQYFPAGVKQVLGVKTYMNPRAVHTATGVVKVYEANADSSVGNELASAPLVIDSMQVNFLEDIKRYATFSSPVSVTGAYYLAVEGFAAGDSSVIYALPSNKGEKLYPCMINQNGGGYMDLGTFTDALIEPVFSYEIIPGITSASNVGNPLKITYTSLATSAISEPAYNFNWIHPNSPDSTYTWDFGDGSAFAYNKISTTHTYSANGSYRVKLQTLMFSYTAVYNSLDPCVDTISRSFSIPLTSSINDVASSSKAFSFYPNPSNGEIFVSAANNINTVTINDILGNQIVTAVVNNTTYKADLHNIAKGVYFLTVRFSNGNVTTKKLTISE